MNDSVRRILKNAIREKYELLTEKQQKFLCRIYGGKDWKGKELEDVLKTMKDDHLGTAIDQIERTIMLNNGGV